jgi:ribonuclease BN (tRNA processing enzyme)
VYRLADPGLQGNALWSSLVARRARGDLLLTHFSPSSVEDDVAADLDMVSQVFGGVFVATGTG